MVLEQAVEVREVGAGVLLWPNAMRVLRRLEVGGAVEEAGAVATRAALRSPRGTPLGVGLAEEVAANLDAPTVVVHRGLLQTILLAALDRHVLRLGAECVGVARLGGNQGYWWASARTGEGAGGSAAEEKAAVERRFGIWHDPIPELIDATLEQAIVRSRLYDRPPLSPWSTGRVGLLGDAAHRMLAAVDHAFAACGAGTTSSPPSPS